MPVFTSFITNLSITDRESEGKKYNMEEDHMLNYERSVSRTLFMDENSDRGH